MARKKTLKFFDPALFAATVPAEIITAERVKEKLLQKKLKPHQKESVKYNAALKNYKAAVIRKMQTPAALQSSLIDTLLEKHYKALTRIIKKYQDINE